MSILLIAAYVSFWRIETLPGGAHYDEAYEGIDAVRILQGARPIFLQENNGRQPLFAYLVALSFRVFGPTPPAVRLVASLPVIGIVFASMKTAETLFNRRVGWLAGLIAAATVLTLSIGRLGTRVSLFPMFLNLAVWQAAVAIKTGRWRHWIVAGFFLGVTHYTYLPSLLIPIAVAAIVALSLVFHFSQTVRRWRAILICNVLMLIIAAPLFSYYIQRPDVATYRSSGLVEATFDQTPESLRQFLTTRVGVIAEMFTVRGDKNPRHNIPQRPLFDAAMSLPFLIGAALLLLQRKTFFLGLIGAVWMLIFLTPTYLTEGAPHFLRSTGILAALFLWPAIGLDAIRTGLTHLHNRFVGFVVAGGVLLSSLNATFHDYYLSNFLASAEVFTAFDGRQTAPIFHVNQLLHAGWTADNLAARPLQPPPFTVWIQPGLWPDEVYNVFAAATPDHYPFFKILSAEADLTPPFALLLDPQHQAEWLAKIPPATPLSVQNVVAGYKLFSIYRTPELLDRPYAIPDHAYRSLNYSLPGDVTWLSVEHPLAAVPGVPFEITAHFVAPAAPLHPDYALRFDVAGPDGILASENQDLLELPLRSQFTDLSFRQTLRLATPPGTYTLTATLVNRVTLQPEPFADSQGRLVDKPISLGMIDVVRPAQPPALDELGPIHRDSFDFGPLSLLGYSFDRNEARPGERVFITMYFHADETIASEMSFNLFTPYLPASQWRARDVFRFTVPARLPADARESHRFTLQLTQSPERAVDLRPIRVIPLERVFTPPPSDTKLTGIRFGDVIELSGYTLTARPESWTLDLIWRALGTPEADLIAFVHIEDESGRIVAQSDAVPANGSRPTPGWLTGEYILDTRHFAPLPAGNYHLFAGLADTLTGKRLDERLEIGIYTAP